MEKHGMDTGPETMRGLYDRAKEGEDLDPDHSWTNDTNMAYWRQRAEDAEATLARVKAYIDEDLLGFRYNDSMAAHIAARELELILQGADLPLSNA